MHRLLNEPSIAGFYGSVGAETVKETVDGVLARLRRELAVGASIGIAVAPSDGGTVEALVRCADVALYVAKAEGRNRFRFFERQMDTSKKSYA